MSGLSRRGGITAWLVEPYRQVRLGLVFLLVNLIFSFIILGVFGFYVWDIYQTMGDYFNITGDQGELIMRKFRLPIVVGVVVMICFITTTLVTSIRYTHAIYGPLVSIHRFLDSLIEGENVGPLVIRKSDQLHDLAAKLNSIRDSLIVKPFGIDQDRLYDFLADIGKDPNLDLTRYSHSDAELAVIEKIKTAISAKNKSTKA